jgi:hypothetical protein
VLALGGGDRILAAADEAGAIRLWDYESRRLMGQVDLYDGGTFGREAPELVLSPDGKRLAAVTRRGEVVLFDIDPESWVARACRVAGLDVEARAPRRCR